MEDMGKWSIGVCMDGLAFSNARGFGLVDYGDYEINIYTQIFYYSTYIVEALC